MTLREIQDLNDFLSQYPFISIIDKSKESDILRLEISEYDVYFDILCEKSDIHNYISCIYRFIYDLLEDVGDCITNTKNIKKVRRKLKYINYLYYFRKDLMDYMIENLLKYPREQENNSI